MSFSKIVLILGNNIMTKKVREDRDTIVLIDGGYLSKLQKHLGQIHLGNGCYLKCHANQLAIRLAKEKNLWCEALYYYTAPPYQSQNPTEDEKRRKSNYDKFITKLKRSGIPRIILREGRCQKIGNLYKQKGVDSLMTSDLIKISQRREVKQIIVLTGDTDFVPILKDIRREYQMKVILAHYIEMMTRKGPFSLSNHLLTVCDDTIQIKKEHFDISPIFSPPNKLYFPPKG